MIRIGALALALAALVSFSAPANAACTKDSDCASGKVCSMGKCVAKRSSAERAAAPVTSDTATGVSSPGIAWGGIGLYGLSVSVANPFFPGQTISSSTTNFGINAGAAYNILALTPDVPLAVFGNIALDFASGATAIPLTGGAGVRYDKLPVHLLGGLGLTVMPVTGGSPTGVGVGLLAMAAYPLAQVDPRFSVQGQFQYHFMNNGYGLWVLNAGVGYAF